MKHWIAYLIICSSIIPNIIWGACPILQTDKDNSISSDTIRKESKFKRFIRFITEVDTNYIEDNKYHAAAMMLAEKTYTTYKLSTRNENGKEQTLEFSQRHPMKVGPYLGYSLLFLGHTFDISANQFMQGRSEFYLSVYSRFIGIDYCYESGDGDFRFKKIKGFSDDFRHFEGQPFGGLHTYLQSWQIYYLFNNKRFSYPAAYSQSTNQRRSCGSFILGFKYAKEKVDFEYLKLPSLFLLDEVGLNEDFKSQHVKYTDYSLSFGYAYNWVFMKNWLANMTLSPTIGYNLSEGESFTTHEKLFNLDEINLDLIARASVVWNNSKYYAGAAVVGQTYSYSKPTFSVHNTRFTLSIYAGMNFLRKKSKKH